MTDQTDDLTKRLYTALRQRDDAALDAALAAGADVHAVLNDRPMVHHATILGMATSLRRMIAAGGDVNVRGENGTTPLMIAISMASAAHPEFFENALENAQVLLDAGATIDTPTTWGATPLHVAANAGNTTAVRWLIERGHPLDGQTSDGTTALATALRAKSEEREPRDKNPHVHRYDEVRALLRWTGAGAG
ncbi:ankyrin repeat domain-containing protein [Burkholderia cepacia]|uniref:ankyrin repeat domain-containing protein n=1 Tax=Burkholderia cepacia TaxID=292 RepID=UPI0026535F83|nr:ankyrin repeat domain-containing protein [Burkholderia cepacia]MDN7857997.1 ankyrin repeat domain-containing protein [Burkholderia cepacia]